MLTPTAVDAGAFLTVISLLRFVPGISDFFVCVYARVCRPQSRSGTLVRSTCSPLLLIPTARLPFLRTETGG
ncbi:hypothetical protein C8R45DRAFT_1017839 [Mycena sanguinolenta]|nr:hypothetical protein C8R45DRAFT_1017839 [Mycena sanguinolenta]